MESHQHGIFFYFSWYTVLIICNIILYLYFMVKLTFYVYKLIDPNTNIPFYVGKGSGDRMYQHELLRNRDYKSTSHNNQLLKNKINKVLRESGRIRYQQYHVNNEHQAFTIEKALIGRHGRRDLKTGTLCNMTNGGEGVSGHTRTEGWKEKHRVAAHNRCRKIDQYTKGGLFIRTFDTYKDILNGDIPTIDASGISRCINNKIKSSGGFRWTWHGMVLPTWVDKPRGPGRGRAPGKPVHQYTKSGTFIKTFPSLIDAGKGVKKHPNTIIECCRGRSQSAGGFYWQYA